MDEAVKRIACELRSALRQRRPLDSALDDVLAATQARATGLWRCREDHLELVGFRAVNEMPLETQASFAAATQTVPLTQTGLGIVKAVIDRTPAIATVDAAGDVLGDSANWLIRFKAKQSLAVPIVREQSSVGVLAISTAQDLHPTAEAWEVTTHVAEQLTDVIVE